MTTREARKALKEDSSKFEQWMSLNNSAIRAIDSTIETLMQIRARLNHDNDVLKGDLTKARRDDQTALDNERDALMVGKLANALQVNADALKSCFDIR